MELRASFSDIRREVTLPYIFQVKLDLKYFKYVKRGY